MAKPMALSSVLKSVDSKTGMRSQAMYIAGNKTGKTGPKGENRLTMMTCIVTIKTVLRKPKRRVYKITSKTESWILGIKDSAICCTNKIDVATTIKVKSLMG